MTEYYKNKATTTHLETKYIFAEWDNFVNQFTQMFKDPEEEVTAEQQLENLTQRGAATEYITQFQIYAAQTRWNKSVLMAKY